MGRICGPLFTCALLVDMRPAFSSPYSCDQRKRHSVSLSNGLVGFSGHGPNIPDVLIFKFCSWMRHAKKWLVSSLGVTIGSIFSLGSEPKMDRIYTTRDITRMADAQSFWDLTVRERPSNSVGFVDFSSDPEVSMSIRGAFGTSPHPALVRSRYIYLGPESLLKCHTMFSHFDLLAVNLIRGIGRMFRSVLPPHYSLGLS